jgi:DNA/RNA-binding domain of Phe-tRNA-synthetase-like protein
MFHFTVEAKAKCPELKIGSLLIGNIRNTYLNTNMDEEKNTLIGELRDKYSSLSRSELLNTPILGKYSVYYKQFNKTYHVLLQLESILHKDKSIPSSSPLIQSMFMAEMKNRYLTAVHDFERIEGPLSADLSNGDCKYTLMNAMEKSIPSDDLFIRDNRGIISSIINGPDSRTKVTSSTSRALFYAYVPFDEDDEQILMHLDIIAGHLRLNDQNISIDEIKVYS